MPSNVVPDGARVTYSQQYRRCGKAGCSHCGIGSRGHGPYWYASWREGSRKLSCYLGRRDPAPVETAATIIATRADLDALSRPPPAASLRVRTLGAFAVWRGEESIPPAAWTSRRAATLFKRLLTAPGHRLLREEASDVLWPDGEPTANAANLRTTIHRLRRVLDGPRAATSHVRLEGDMLVLVMGVDGGHELGEEGWLDATAFAHAASTALSSQDTRFCRVALELYGGDYLPDDLYADWVTTTRALLRQQYLDVLMHLATRCCAQGELDEAEDCLQRIIVAEPGHEEAAAMLMVLLAESGRRAQALRVYQALATVLEDDLDVTPMAEIMALRARLLAQESVPAPAPRRYAWPAGHTNLPAPLSSFVGRAWEIDEIADLVARHRMVTLTGPGGCGKTRLALEVAATRGEAQPDGVWLVELAALADPALVPQAVAAALHLSEQPGHSLLDTLIRFLGPRDLLLVLDNCEHLLGACAALTSSLLAACPQLRVLATSREGLAVAGERAYLVPPLAAPNFASPPPLEQIATYEAVQLFLARAQARRPALVLTAANATVVAQICTRLDGLPLAIELAAARVGVLPLEGIAARLDDRFRLLTGGPRTALPRQQTLQAAIDWSYALLSPAERLLLQRLAVFAGGWTLEAAEEVCATENGRDEEVLDLLGALVDKSFVLVRGLDGAPRYGFLETMRSYAQEHLAECGEGEWVAQRHSAYYLALAERAEEALWGDDQASWFRRLDAEQDNLRAVLRRAQHRDEVALILQVAGALWRFWVYHGDYHGWRHVIESALARAEADTVLPSIRAKALYAAAWLAFHQWDYVATAALGAESLQLARAERDPLAIRQALVVLGKAAHGQGRYADAVQLFAEAVGICRMLGGTPFLAPSLASMGMALAKAGEGSRAEERLEEALVLLRQQGEKFIAAQTARSLGYVVLSRGDTQHAAALFRESLHMSAETGHKQGMAETLEGVAAVAAASTEAGSAAHLFAAADIARQTSVQPLHPDDHRILAPYLASARTQLGDAAWETAWAEGRALSLDQAAAEAAAI